MNNKEYSTPLIMIARLNETDIITTSKGTETSILEIEQGDWAW